MRKCYIIILIIIILTEQATAAAAFQIPSKETYEAAANIGYGDFRCADDIENSTDPQIKILNYEFVKNPKKQKFMQVCRAGSVTFILREDQSKKWGRVVRGGMYTFSQDPAQWHKKYIERVGHDFGTICEIRHSSQERPSVDYLCYNPTVASAYTKGYEFSFRIIGKKRKTYARDCTVNFGAAEADLKNDCGRWKLF